MSSNKTQNRKKTKTKTQNQHKSNLTTKSKNQNKTQNQHKSKTPTLEIDTLAEDVKNIKLNDDLKIKRNSGRGRKETIPEAVRIAVWNNYVGRDKGEDKCFIGCGEPITRSNFECGHVEAEATGGAVTIKNLRPICSKCNKSIGKKNMDEFITQYGFKKHKHWDRHLLEEKSGWFSHIPFFG